MPHPLTGMPRGHGSEASERRRQDRQIVKALLISSREPERVDSDRSRTRVYYQGAIDNVGYEVDASIDERRVTVTFAFTGDTAGDCYGWVRVSKRRFARADGARLPAAEVTLAEKSFAPDDIGVIRGLDLVVRLAAQIGRNLDAVDETVMRRPPPRAPRR